MDYSKFYKISILVAISWICTFSTSQRNLNQTYKKAFTVYLKDSVRVDVDLVFNSTNQPILYHSSVVSPVCEEGVCYELEADIYWDLLGNFSDYKESFTNPFTKFDHIRFTTTDHKKMREILADKTSLLANYEPVDLVDNSIQIQSNVIDGMAGATYKSLSGAVVRGAVYSSHTLWHIVNGEISKRIRTHTESLINDDLLVQMLQSNNYHLQFFALNRIDDNNEKFQPYLFELLTKGESYVPFFAIEKLKDTTWSMPKYQELAVMILPNVEFKLRNELLNKLQNNALSGEALSGVIKTVQNLEKSQIEKVFKILAVNKNSLKSETIVSLVDLLASEDNTISKNAYDLLTRLDNVNMRTIELMELYKKRIK